MKNKVKLAYWIVTGLLTAMLLMGAGMYIFTNEVAVMNFTALGFPIFLIYPMAVAKILGAATLWFSPAKWLKEWAYAGIFFNMLLAVGAHLNVGDGEVGGAAVVLALTLISYALYRRLEASQA